MNNQIQFEVNSLLRMASLLDENSIKRKEYIELAEQLLLSQQSQQEKIKEKMLKISKWVIENKPSKNKSFFISYKDICKNAVGYIPENPSYFVKESLENNMIEMYVNFGIGLQFGVKSNDCRGIRIYASF